MTASCLYGTLERIEYCDDLMRLPICVRTLPFLKSKDSIENEVEVESICIVFAVDNELLFTLS